VIRGAILVRPIIENTCLEGLDRIFRKDEDVLTKRGHQGRSISINRISLVIDGLKLWPFESSSPNVLIR